MIEFDRGEVFRLLLITIGFAAGIAGLLVLSITMKLEELRRRDRELEDAKEKRR